MNSKIDPTADKNSIEFSSPDEAIKMKFKIAELDGISGCPVYSVDYKGETVITDSRFGLSLKDIPTMKSGFSIICVRDEVHDSVWAPVYGERSEIRDNFRQVKIELKLLEHPDYLLDITFRIYNEGLAFCYTVKSSQREDKKTFTIESEETEFCFLANHTTWTTYSAQGRYSTVHLSDIKPGCERPFVISIEDSTYVALAEAKLVDYTRMKFKLSEKEPHCIVSDLSGHVQGTLPVTTPWRVIMIADTPGKLLENNFIMLNLNDLCEIDDTSWIKPGKVIREVTLTTQGGKACVDFAVKHHLQYVEYDAGWYGGESDKSSDASFVSVDPKRSGGPLNLQEVIRYADEKGIGIILYVNHIALEQQLHQLLPIYREWGIKEHTKDSSLQSYGGCS
jgi:alpha-glucosidase